MVRALSMLSMLFASCSSSAGGTSFSLETCEAEARRIEADCDGGLIQGLCRPIELLVDARDGVSAESCAGWAADWNACLAAEEAVDVEEGELCEDSAYGPRCGALFEALERCLVDYCECVGGDDSPGCLATTPRVGLGSDRRGRSGSAGLRSR